MTSSNFTEQGPSIEEFSDEHGMDLALAQARLALERGEFPVGCVITAGNRVLATGRRQGTAAGGRNEIFHAEILALESLYALTDAPPRSSMTLYSTMEPCLMCLGAILISKIGRIVWAYEDVMGGACGVERSRLSPLYRDPAIRIIGGVRRAESLSLFRRFFADPSNGGYWAGSLLARYTLEQAG